MPAARQSGFDAQRSRRGAHAFLRHLFAGPRRAVGVARVDQDRLHASPRGAQILPRHLHRRRPPRDSCVNTAAADGGVSETISATIVLHHFADSRISRGVTKPQRADSFQHLIPLHRKSVQERRRRHPLFPLQLNLQQLDRASAAARIQLRLLARNAPGGNSAIAPARAFQMCRTAGRAESRSSRATAEIPESGSGSPARGMLQSICPSSFFRIGAYVACESSCGSRRDRRQFGQRPHQQTPRPPPPAARPVPPPFPPRRSPSPI